MSSWPARHVYGRRRLLLQALREGGSAEISLLDLTSVACSIRHGAVTSPGIATLLQSGSRGTTSVQARVPARAQAGLAVADGASLANRHLRVSPRRRPGRRHHGGPNALLLFWRGHADPAHQARPRPRFVTTRGLSRGIARDALLAKLETLGVGRVPSRMSTNSELRFAMSSGATPAPTPRSRRCLRMD
jgi:hypothetical protein